MLELKWPTSALAASTSSGSFFARSPSVPNSLSGPSVDCSLCVQVCPTGIDIRKGLQCESIGCAFIDARDDVIGEMNYRRGLFGSTTGSGMKNKWSSAAM